jgi:hypothetical protein
MRKPLKKPTFGKSKPSPHRPPSGRRKSPTSKPHIGGQLGKMKARMIPPWRIAITGAVRAFDKLYADYDKSRKGHRARLYEIAQKCYAVAQIFRKHPKQYARFKEDAFWQGKRQKPKDDKIVRAVLSYATKSHPELFETLISKIAKVLENLALDNVPPRQVIERIKEGGGIQKMYSALSPNPTDAARIDDDVDLLTPDAQHGDEDHENGFDDQDESREGDAGRSHKGQGSKPNASPAGRPSRQTAEMTDTISEGIKITDAGGIASPPSPTRRRVKFDWDRDVVVNVRSAGVIPESLRVMKTVRIIGEIQEPDEDDWWGIKALRVESIDEDGSDDGGWPDEV